VTPPPPPPTGGEGVTLSDGDACDVSFDGCIQSCPFDSTNFLLRPPKDLADSAPEKRRTSTRPGRVRLWQAPSGDALRGGARRANSTHALHPTSSAAHTTRAQGHTPPPAPPLPHHAQQDHLGERAGGST
jgi:hypothetical protein